MTSAPSHERPLNKTARLSLVVTAALTILLFYAYVTLAALFLLTWIGLELLVALALARFGVASLIAPDIGRNRQLLKLLLFSLWVRSQKGFRVTLREEQAPGVFAIGKSLADRLQIPPPDFFHIEMNAGAWVELRGLRQNIGSTHVGLGYDLLAGLNTREVEAVLAHELAHAKLINRSFKRWLNFGLGRAAKLTGQLAGTVDWARQQKKEFFLAEKLFAGSDRITRWCARLIATYSRQDEFDADRGAAELCGAGALKTSLLKLDALEDKLTRLPWNERMAQIQSDEGLSPWLVKELSLDGPPVQSDTEKLSIANPYSTHPSNRDRLAALADFSDADPQNAPSGITLLADPNGIARELAAEIERRLLIEEAKDNKTLRGWLRKLRRNAPLRLADWPAVICGLGTLVVFFVALAEATVLSALVMLAAGCAVTYGLHRAFYYRDREKLPVPAYELFFPGKEAAKEEGTIEERQGQLEKEIEQRLAGTPSKKRNAILLAREAYAALAECDYLRAHVSARLCLKRNDTSIPGKLALAIASAALGQTEQSQSLLTNLLQRTTLRSRSTRWGSAWALALLGDWLPAEALLQEIIRDGEEKTFFALLAVCQHQRGKLRSAISNARKAIHDETKGAAAQRLLIRALLDHGNLKEAEKQLLLCENAATTEQSLRFSWLRLRLLQRRFADAEPWVERIEKADTKPGVLLALGRLFEDAREDLRATAFFERARSAAHNPDACLGLARLAARGRDESRAIELARAAVDLTKPSHEESRAAIGVFPEVLGVLLSFRDPVAGGRAWVATLPGDKTIEPFAGQKLLIHSPTEKEARSWLEDILAALLPGKLPGEPLRYGLELAPAYYQPVGPVRPGVQSFFQ